LRIFYPGYREKLVNSPALLKTLNPQSSELKAGRYALDKLVTESEKSIKRLSV